MAPRRPLFLRTTFALLLILVVLVVTRDLWLPVVGAVLIHDDGPSKADVALLLAGDSWGFRMTEAAHLVQQGFVPKVLVSGPSGMYGLNEADAAIHWAEQQGYPSDWFVPLRHTATSTRAESEVTLDYMRSHGIKSFLLVTSNYHTARSRRVFLHTERAMGGGPDFRVVASHDKYYEPDTWWKSREGLKTAFMEWCKTVTGPLGI